MKAIIGRCSSAAGNGIQLYGYGHSEHAARLRAHALWADGVRDSIEPGEGELVEMTDDLYDRLQAGNPHARSCLMFVDGILSYDAEAAERTRAQLERMELERKAAVPSHVGFIFW